MKDVKEPPRKEKSTYMLFIYTTVILCVAAAIGLILWYTLPKNNPEPRTDTVADCIPEGGENEDLCNDRGYVSYSTSNGCKGIYLTI